MLPTIRSSLFLLLLADCVLERSVLSPVFLARVRGHPRGARCAVITAIFRLRNHRFSVNDRLHLHPSCSVPGASSDHSSVLFCSHHHPLTLCLPLCDERYHVTASHAADQAGFTCPSRGSRAPFVGWDKHPALPLFSPLRQPSGVSERLYLGASFHFFSFSLLTPLSWGGEYSLNKAMFDQNL